MYFPAILFCETSRRNERKNLCYDGARKILWAIERVCSIQRLAYPGCKEKRVYVGVPHFMWSWRVIEMVMKRSISVNPSGRCWIEGLCWILWQNTLPSCDTFFITYIILCYMKSLMPFSRFNSTRFRSQEETGHLCLLCQHRVDFAWYKSLSK